LNLKHLIQAAGADLGEFRDLERKYRRNRNHGNILNNTPIAKGVSRAFG
jgi:hypothetical protein